MSRPPLDTLVTVLVAGVLALTGAAAAGAPRPTAAHARTGSHVTAEQPRARSTPHSALRNLDLGPGASLGLQGIDSIATDAAHGRVYAAGTNASGSRYELVVADPDGHVSRRITSSFGHLAADPEHGVVYSGVARTITRIDPRGGAPRAYDLPSDTSVVDLAYAGDRVFYLDYESGTIGALDPDSGLAHPGLTSGGVYGFVASPDGTRLYVLTSNALTAYRVGKGVTTTLVPVTTRPVTAFGGAIALTPDGKLVAVAAAASSDHRVTTFDTATLRPVSACPSTAQASWVALRSDGMLVASSGYRTVVCAARSSAVYRTYGAQSQVKQLAFVGPRLVSVATVQVAGDIYPALHVVVPRRERSLDLRVGRRRAEYGEPMHLVVHVTGGERARVSLDVIDEGARPDLLGARHHLRTVDLAAGRDVAVQAPARHNGFVVATAIAGGDREQALDYARVYVRARTSARWLGAHRRHGRYAVYGSHRTARDQAVVAPAGAKCPYFDIEYQYKRQWQHLDGSGCLTPRHGRVILGLVGDPRAAGIPFRVRVAVRGGLLVSGSIGEWLYVEFARSGTAHRRIGGRPQVMLTS